MILAWFPVDWFAMLAVVLLLSADPVTLATFGEEFQVESNFCSVRFAQYFSTGVPVSGFIQASGNSERWKMTGKEDNVGFLATESGVQQFQLSLWGCAVLQCGRFCAQLRLSKHTGNSRASATVPHETGTCRFQWKRASPPNAGIRAGLVQTATNILAKLETDTLPAIDTAKTAALDTAFQAYKDVETEQGGGQADATGLRTQLGKGVKDIIARRREIQVNGSTHSLNAWSMAGAGAWRRNMWHK
jgi:hypothetical protein